MGIFSQRKGQNWLLVKMGMTRAGERREQCECGHAEQTPFHTLSSTKQGGVTEFFQPLCMAIFGGSTSGKSLIFLAYRWHDCSWLSTWHRLYVPKHFNTFPIVLHLLLSKALPSSSGCPDVCTWQWINRLAKQQKNVLVFNYMFAFISV